MAIIASAVITTMAVAYTLMICPQYSDTSANGFNANSNYIARHKIHAPKGFPKKVAFLIFDKAARKLCQVHSHKAL
jgi:hypothetical protein